MHSRLESESAAVDAAVKKNLGGLRTRMAAGDEHAAITYLGTPLGALTFRDLRRAIVLNEILSPPVSIRASESPW